MKRCHDERYQNQRRRRRGGGGGFNIDVLETQDEDVQGKEKKEDVVKLIETVVEEYLKDPKMENVEDENVKVSEAEKYGKNMEGGHPSCDLCSFVTAGKKRNS